MDRLSNQHNTGSLDTANPGNDFGLGNSSTMANEFDRHLWISNKPSNDPRSSKNDPLFSWLSEHHLEAYYEKLVTEDITYDILEDLRKEDLKELVPRVGDRIRLWRALSEKSQRRPSTSETAETKSGVSNFRRPTAALSSRIPSSDSSFKRVNFFKPDLSVLAIDIDSTSTSEEIKHQIITAAQLSPDKTYKFHDGFDFYDNGELLHDAIFTKGASELSILVTDKESPNVTKTFPPRSSSPPTMSTRPTSDEITNNLANFFPEAQRTQLNASVRHSVYVQNRLFMVEDYRQSMRFSKRLSFVAPHEVAALSNVLSESDRRSSLLSVHQLADRAVAQSKPLTSKPIESKPTEPKPTEPKPTEPKPTEPKPTESESKESTDPTEPQAVPKTDSSGYRNKDLNTETSEEDVEAWDKYFEEDDALFLKELEKEEMNPSEWVRGKLIGHGSFGDVYLAIILFSGGFQAVKQVPLLEGDVRMRKMADALRHEIMMLRNLEHRNIVQYRGFKSEGEFINIFLEYVPGGSLASLLADVQTISEPLIKLYIKQCLIGLSYLHSKGIIHRDIKGANVLVGLNGVVKISDFGLSLQEDAARARQSMQGTAFFMAPEVARGRGGVTTKADIWSLGCLIVELFTGQHPYPTLLQVQALWAVGRGNAPDIPENASPQLKDVLDKCFKMNPDERATAEELLVLPFFDNVTVPNDVSKSEFSN